MSPKVKRLGVILAVAALIGIAVILVLGALRDNIVFFYTPSEIESTRLTSGQSLRLGGLVKDGSVTIEGLQSVFTVTDGSADIVVIWNDWPNALAFTGMGLILAGGLYRLFREKQKAVDVAPANPTPARRPLRK